MSGLTAFSNGPVKELHANLYSNVTGSAMRNLITSQIQKATPLPDDVEEKHNKAKKGLLSAGLVTGTGATLAGEAWLQLMNSQDKSSARAALGYMQKIIGLAGFAYYGTKFKDNPEHTEAGLMSTGYALFTLEGLSRMLEAPKKNLPVTGLFGMGADGVKMFGAQTLLCRFAYAAAFLANTIESRHGTPQPKNPGFANALWNLSHSMKSNHVASIQGTAALGMFTNAAGKINEYLSTKPAVDQIKEQRAQERAQEDAEKLDRRMEFFFSKCFSDDAEFHHKLDQVCNTSTDEECKKEFDKLMEEYEKK